MIPLASGIALTGVPWNVLGCTLSPQTEDWSPKGCSLVMSDQHRLSVGGLCSSWKEGMGQPDLGAGRLQIKSTEKICLHGKAQQR